MVKVKFYGYALFKKFPVLICTCYQTGMPECIVHNYVLLELLADLSGGQETEIWMTAIKWGCP